FLVVRAGLRCVDQKIHLKPLAIGMAKNVHEPCLDPAAPHPSDDVQDSNSPRCAFHLVPPFLSAWTITPALTAPWKRVANARPNAEARLTSFSSSERNARRSPLA